MTTAEAVDVSSATPPGTGWIGKPLVLSRWVSLEANDETGAVVFHSATGARLRVSQALYAFLRRFLKPISVSDALGRPPDAKVVEHVRTLVAKGFLVDPTMEEAPRAGRRTTPVLHTLFNCPAVSATEGVADVMVLGVPYDLGTRGTPGMREGPTEVRRRSLDFEYRLDFATGRPRGWFDVDRGRRILEGVRFGDLGDVALLHGESQCDFFGRLGDLTLKMSASGAFPLFLGGDHTITYPIVESLQRQRTISVLQLDAHTDFDPSFPTTVVNSSCVGLRVRALPGVGKLVQVGHRGFTLNPKEAQAPEGVRLLTVSRIRTQGPGAIVAALPEKDPVYLTLDINVLDPIFAPGTSYPTPGGFVLDELKAILARVCSERDVVGMDVVEVQPSRDQGQITTISACHLLLVALGEVCRRRAIAADG